MSERGDLPRRGAPQAAEAGSSVTVGPPNNYVEFNTPAEPVSQPVGAFPAIAPPKAQPRRRPRRPRRPRIVVTVPMWVLLGLAILAAIAALLFIPAIRPWPSPAPLTPSDDTAPGVGVIGTGDPDAGIGPNAGPDATPGATSGSQPSTRAGTEPSGTSAPEPTATGSGAPPAVADVYISHFSATFVVTGYRVTVGITNRGAGPGNWEHVGVQVSGGIQLSMAVEEPETGVRVFQGTGRACLAPTTSDTANLTAGETLTVVFRIDTLLSQTPGPAQTPDRDGCAAAES